MLSPLVDLLLITFATFGATLAITKGKIFSCKREFVRKRYEAAQVAGNKPSFIHTWWHAVITCAMCCGFWVGLLFTLSELPENWPLITFGAFGLSWLLHCLESLLVYGAAYFQQERERK